MEKNESCEWDIPCVMGKKVEIVADILGFYRHELNFFWFCYVLLRRSFPNTSFVVVSSGHLKYAVFIRI